MGNIRRISDFVAAYAASVGRHCHADNSFAKQTDTCHAELVSTSCNRHGNKTLKQVQGDKAAFTLAEILITLGIIGVVAALTIPTLIQNHRNKVVETRLKKFYSTINQAISMAELDYGDRTYWHNTNDVNTHKDGSPVKGNDPREKWLNKYIVPYIKTIKADTHTIYNNIPAITFTDGSSIALLHPTYMNDWVFYIGDINKCKKNTDTGICKFTFNYAPEAATQKKWKYVGRNFEPYKWNYNGDIKKLEDACINGKSLHNDIGSETYCTALIQYNGWKIPKNYPYKVRY